MKHHPNPVTRNSKIYVAGHTGMVGSALVRCLRRNGYKNLILATRAQLNLEKQQDVYNFLNDKKPDYIFMAAARVGGIAANNKYRAEFIFENIIIQTNIIHGAWLAGTHKMMFLGSSCVYPKNIMHPIKEQDLLSGYLESTNEPYAIAKIAGIKMCESYNKQYGTKYISVMPTNLYGINDHYNLDNCHVLPALIRKAHEAKIWNKNELVVWGTGSPKREFLYIDDLADACIVIMEHSNPIDDLINIGCGSDVSIKELAETISDIIGFRGKIIFDSQKPDGIARKLLDVSKINQIGWNYKTSLREGLKLTYQDFINQFTTYNQE